MRGKSKTETLSAGPEVGLRFTSALPSPLRDAPSVISFSGEQSSWPSFVGKESDRTEKPSRARWTPPNASVVATRLRLRRIRPLPGRIRAKGRGLESALHIPGLGEKVKQRDVVIFTRQLATMIDAGLPIVQALDLLAQQTENKTFSGVIATLKHDVESGSALAESLAKHPAVFDELYTNMVSAGELGGMLDTILIRLAVYMEKAVKLKAKIKSAMIYPLSVISVAVLVTALLLVYVIPVFGEMFAGFGEEMPLPTQIAINLSSVAIAYFWHMVAGVVGTIVSVRTYYRTERGRQMIDGVLLRLPVVGDILRKTAVARFTRTLSTLVSSGVPILDSLAITGKTAGNKVVEKAVLAARQSISEGKTLADPLIKSQVFPPMGVSNGSGWGNDWRVGHHAV